MPVRVVFFGNSASTFTARHFRALLNVSAELVAVVDVPPNRKNTTNPLPDDLPDFVEEANRQGIEVFEPASPNDSAFIAKVREKKPALFIAAGYASILKEEILAVPHLVAANFHASLLPDYRGMHPVFWTLRGGERWAGLTVHVMDQGIDTGDIIYQVKVRTRRDDTVATLYDRIMDRSVGLVGQLVTDAQHGSIPRRPQPEGAGSYYSSTTEEDFHLDWSWPAEKMRRFITITPGKCFVEMGDGRVCFLNADTEPHFKAAPPGTLLQIGRTRATVATGQGAISSSLVQADEKEAESFAAFCRRRGFVPGHTLGV